MWIVEKSHTRTYGYSLSWHGSTPAASWAPTGRIGWYKYKQDAINRADELNGIERQTKVQS